MVIYIHQTNAVALFLFKLPTKKYRMRYRKANILYILVRDYWHKQFPRGRLCTCSAWLPFTRAGVTVWEPHQLLYTSLLPPKKRAWGGGILLEKASFPISKWYNLWREQSKEQSKPCPAPLPCVSSAAECGQHCWLFEDTWGTKQPSCESPEQPCSSFKGCVRKSMTPWQHRVNASGRALMGWKRKQNKKRLFSGLCREGKYWTKWYTGKGSQLRGVLNADSQQDGLGIAQGKLPGYGTWKQQLHSGRDLRMILLGGISACGLSSWWMHAAQAAAVLVRVVLESKQRYTRLKMGTRNNKWQGNTESEVALMIKVSVCQRSHSHQ